jgi:hypothetical protein
MTTIRQNALVFLGRVSRAINNMSMLMLGFDRWPYMVCTTFGLFSGLVRRGRPRREVREWFLLTQSARLRLPQLAEAKARYSG